MSRPEKRRPPQAEKPGRVPPGLKEKVERILLAGYAPPCVVVNADDDVVMTLGPVVRVTGIRVDAASSHLPDAVPRDLWTSLHALLERARGDAAGVVHGNVFIGEAGRRRPVDVTLRRLDAGAGNDLHLLIFEDPEWRSMAGREVGEEPEEAPAPPAGPGPSPPAGSTARTPPAAAAAAARARRVLVIEDHLDQAEGMRLLLELRGYQVAVAHDGTQGLDKARQFHPGVVLCDAGLPGSLDGYALARRFRGDAELRSTALVALTDAGEKEEALAVAAGFDAHLTKPVDPGGLIRLLETLPRRT